MTTTYESILTAHDVDIPAHLQAQAEVPILTGPQRQGDLIILPTGTVRPSATVEKAQPIPAVGVPVIRGEATSNTHLLVGDGTWAPCADGQDLGVVDVATEAFLLHPEHGAQGLGAGTYLIRRQREQADEIRYVAD